jgi:hypothetical protein
MADSPFGVNRRKSGMDRDVIVMRIIKKKVNKTILIDVKPANATNLPTLAHVDILPGSIQFPLENASNPASVQV